MKLIITRLLRLKIKCISCFLPTVFSSQDCVVRTEKLKAQITIDCVCLRLIATVSLASVHNNHNDSRSQTLVPFVLHRRERLWQHMNVASNCSLYLFCHMEFIQTAIYNCFPWNQYWCQTMIHKMWSLVSEAIVPINVLLYLSSEIKKCCKTMRLDHCVKKGLLI